MNVNIASLKGKDFIEFASLDARNPGITGNLMVKLTLKKNQPDVIFRQKEFT